MAKKIENLQEGIQSDFLKNLQQAVESGDPSIGAKSIEKINEIHKLASTMDSEVAGASFDKRVEEAGLKDVVLPEERKLMSVESEKQRLKIEKEEEKLKFISNIQNAEYDIKAVIVELDEMKFQYAKVIELQEEELNILKIKYEAKYDEKYGEEETKEK